MALPIVVLISGAGSNLSAILEAIDAGRCDAEVSCVLSDRSKATGLSLARERGISTGVVRVRDHADRAAWDRALAAKVAEFRPGLVVLAGFMKIVGPAMIERFASQIINVHPALLPAFPGTDGPADAIAAGVTVSGCTVHLVDAGVDTGPILAQGVVPVLPGDDANRLHERIKRVEHRLLPAVIDAVARGELTLSATPALRDDSARDAQLGDRVLLSPALGS